MKFTYAGIDINVTGRFVKEVYGFLHEHESKNTMHHNRFQIKIMRDNHSATFSFTGSTADWQAGKTELDESDLKNALECILNEGIQDFSDFEGFCSEFGYSTDSRSAEHIYLALLKNDKKLNDIGFTQDELVAIVDEINNSE
jgi:hypothetical protein